MTLEATGLQVRYRNGALGVSDVSLRIDPGEVVAIFGPNGAGKTTSVRACTGFLKMERAAVVSGTIRVGGAVMTNAQPHTFYKKGVFCIPERGKIFPHLTVAENLAAIRHLPDRRERAQVRERIFSLFPGLERLQPTQAGRLSGGEQQMLAIARALHAQPRYLIIDEMSLGLHVSIIRPLFDAIREIANSGTAVMVVDESSDAALDVANRCYILRSGHVVDEGAPERFRGNELLAAGYVGDV